MNGRCAVPMCRTLTFEMASVACTWLRRILDLTNVAGTSTCFVLVRCDDRSNHDSFATFNKSEVRTTKDLNNPEYTGVDVIYKLFQRCSKPVYSHDLSPPANVIFGLPPLRLPHSKFLVASPGSQSLSDVTWDVFQQISVTNKYNNIQ